MRCRPALAVSSVCFALAAPSLMVGCGGPAVPKTSPVHGRVAFKGNTGPIHRLTGGKVWFQSATDPETKAMGIIDEDATFTMNLVVQVAGVQGVPKGEYKVRIEPPLDENRKPQRGLIHPRYLDFDKSGLKVSVPEPDEILFELERPGR